jgi:5-methylcytosine-specific restriction enzyme subunit McrC
MGPTASLSVFEHQNVPVESGAANSISTEELIQLTRLAVARPGFCTLGHRSVKFAQYAGLVRIGDRLLEILPKVEDGAMDATSSRGDFLRMLALADNVSIFSGQNVGHGLYSHTLLDIFIKAFFDSLATLLRIGLLRGYRSVEEDLPLVRGRLMLARHATVNAMRVDRLSCQFDDLTADNEWNRVLNCALHLTRPWIRSIELGKRWLELSSALRDIALLPVNDKAIGKLRFNRQVLHYRPAIQWAHWIVTQLSPNLRAADSEAPEMLCDMNRLFESAVFVSLQRGAGISGLYEVTRQDREHFLATLDCKDRSKVSGLRPDIVISRNKSVVAVADTKWTCVRKNQHGYLVPDDGHIYQMLAYASVYECEELALIYPWHSGLEGAKPTAYELPKMGSRRPIVHLLCSDTSSENMRLKWPGKGDIIAGLLG